MEIQLPLEGLGTPLDELEVSLEDGRISCRVSGETVKMWHEILEHDKMKLSIKGRYYPAKTLERMIKADYDYMKAFGELS